MNSEMGELSARRPTQRSRGLMKWLVIGLLIVVAVAGAMELSSWAGRSAGGGVDSGTWELIGASQMGA